MRIIKFSIFSIVLLATKQSNAQGCVAIRSGGNTCSIGKPENTKGYSINLNNRYFKSYKHFVGTKEQKERVEKGTEVINHSYALDITVTRLLNNRTSISVGLPILSNVRSSMYEHYGNTSTSPNARNKTKSFGIGDTRITVYRWILDPRKYYQGNIQLGLGLKLPTGDYNVQDYFHRPGTGGSDSTIVGPVDQSIQLGDGGTGIITEANASYNISNRVGLFSNLYYLLNPREQNGVSTSRGVAPNVTSIKYFTGTMSVPDQYLARLGVNYMAGYFSFSGGLRMEGIPAEDIIGGSRGFRRPGYVLSAEPVVSYAKKNTNIYMSVPVAVVRNRIQSYSDKLRTKDSGTKIQGDAAFADYLVNIGVSFKLLSTI